MLKLNKAALFYGRINEVFSNRATYCGPIGGPINEVSLYNIQPCTNTTICAIQVAQARPMKLLPSV